MMKVEHIGILVKDLKKSVEFFENYLGLRLGKVEEIRRPDRLLKIAFFPLENLEVEIFEAHEERGFFADFIKAKGEGVHHVAFEVEDIQEIVDELKKKGVNFVIDVRSGSRNTKIAFIDPGDSQGILIELVQKSTTSG